MRHNAVIVKKKKASDMAEVEGKRGGVVRKKEAYNI